MRYKDPQIGSHGQKRIYAVRNQLQKIAPALTTDEAQRVAVGLVEAERMEGIKVTSAAMHAAVREFIDQRELAEIEREDRLIEGAHVLNRLRELEPSMRMGAVIMVAALIAHDLRTDDDFSDGAILARLAFYRTHRPRLFYADDYLNDH